MKGKMKKIFKYPLSHRTVQRFALPRESEILRVEKQHGALQMWALVDPSGATEPREFHIYGTGHPITDWSHLNYLDTVFDGPYVWHIFERIPAGG